MNSINSENKMRLDWIDTAKGYGMLLVILGHIGKFGIPRLWIYSFSMPLFFFLSGFVFNSNYNFGTFLKKKVKSIIIPYFALGIPLILFQSAWDWYGGKFTSAATLEMIFKFIIQRRKWTLWFLSCLFFLYLIFYFVNRFVKNEILKHIICVLVTVIGLLYYRMGGKPLFWNIDICFTAYPFFYLGTVCRNRKISDKKVFQSKKSIIAAAAVFLIINLITFYINIRFFGDGLEMYNSHYSFEPLTYISAFAGVFAVCCFSMLGSLRLIKYIGRYSLLYLAWHETIMIPVAEKILAVLHLSLENYNKFEWGIHLILVEIIVVTLLTLCNMLITKSRLKFMVGKA